MEKLEGIIPALVTPVLDGGEKLNKPVLKEITKRVLDNGVNGVCVLGGTGEYCALTEEVRTEAIETVVETVNGKVPVVVGLVEPGVGETIKMAKKAKKIGGDAALIVSPYYCATTQPGIIDYYCKVSDAIDMPIVLYNVPYRTGTTIEPQTVSALADKCNVIGIKECGCSSERCRKLVNLAGNKISLLSGEDTTVVLEMSFGFKGGILASATLIPDKWANIYNLVQKGDIKGAREAHDKLSDFFSALFSECNPIPLKGAMDLLGYKVGTVIPPLTPVKEENLAKLKTVMKDLAII